MHRFLLVLGLLTTICASAQNLPNWAIGPFVRPEGKNPIINVDTVGFVDPMSKTWVHWKESDVFNPAAVLKEGKICVLYRAEDNSAVGIGKRTSRIGLMESENGVDITYVSPRPVLYPAEDNQKEYEWPGGCEDPRVAVTAGGVYVMLYTQWNRKVPRLAVAHSKDLKHWTKYGPAFSKAYSGKFRDMATKSASIVTAPIEGRLVITKINGLYRMYWGEAHVYMATSSDLINWNPLVDQRGNLIELISPRKGYFDSRLTECGPPAVLTKNGIVLMYNGKNADNNDADKNYTLNSYCAGQVLFDKNDPTKVLARLDTPFLKPEADFEKSGQYPAGTVFIEGLVLKGKKWFLYYGCADSKVGVAISDDKK
ncbi:MULTISPECIES: glycoside hydrolase family 130 protein [Chitinophagaceae]